MCYGDKNDQADLSLNFNRSDTDVANNKNYKFYESPENPNVIVEIFLLHIFQRSMRSLAAVLFSRFSKLINELQFNITMRLYCSKKLLNIDQNAISLKIMGKYRTNKINIKII